MPTLHTHTFVRFSDRLLALSQDLQNSAPGTVAAVHMARGLITADPVVLAMDSLYRYAQRHLNQYGSLLADDSVLGVYWLDAIKGVRGLLNGTGQFDGGTLESLFWRALEVAGFDEGDL